MPLAVIDQEDLRYEKLLLQNPHNLKTWLKYYEYKSSNALSSYHDLVFILSRSLSYLKRSYKLWMLYLNLKVSYQIETVHDVVKTFEVAVEFLNKYPNFWLLYLNYLIDNSVDIKATRLKFDTCLRILPIAQHFRIWPKFLKFGDLYGNILGFNIYKRYYIFKKAMGDLEKENSVKYEDILDKLIEFATKDNLVDLCGVFNEFIRSPSILSSLTNKTELDLYLDYLNSLIKHNDNDYNQIENLVTNSISKFPDQKFKFILKLTTFYINTGNYGKVRDIFEANLSNCLTVKDFVSIYDAYLEFEEANITKLMGEIDSKSNDEDPELNIELELRLKVFENLMNKREFLLNDVFLRQNPNNVQTWLDRIKLYDESNQVIEILETYVKAITTIDPRKVNSNLHMIWLGYIKIYESNGDIVTARSIFPNAVKVPFKNVTDLVEIWLEWCNFEIRANEEEGIDNAITLLENCLNIKGDIQQIQKIDFNDESIPAQSRLLKSIKLWSFYLDLVETTGDISKTSGLYERMIDLKIARPINIVNYCNFLEENKLFEKSLQIYERSLKIFKFPILFEIYNIYLAKFLKFQKIINISNERVRDVFDDLLEKCPNSDMVKPITILYANFEEENKLLSRMFKIYNTGINKLESPSEKLKLYKIYLSKASQYLQITSLRTIYESITNDESLPINEDLMSIVENFVNLEIKLDDLNRARAILKHFYDICSSIKSDVSIRLRQNLKEFWKLIELKNGSEETFKDMLRYERLCDLKYGRENEEENSKVLKGFVKSSQAPIIEDKTNNDEKDVNPDAIDLNMDDDEDDDDDDNDEDESSHVHDNA
ncbi:hypothetical protein PACTADRAFT_49292 [Pachysolen tannophilus NRRL Y-2460]|uniref:Pre-mRNA-splicing factor SYF1 n=1 Tax=Pachysolen tannophilus NRRL Y-2460 TaxID=669874 RepID=A0A1E4TVT7_PACTA|nr:hypothetical protein PACTADRAFT_49292 [Pachysolen tannophilus NRRL Y-2460]